MPSCSLHFARAGIALLVVVALNAPVAAQNALWRRQGDDIAIDQPRVGLLLKQGNKELDLFLPFLLDTGANGILIANAAFLIVDLLENDTIALATRPGGSLVEYEERGVAGTSFLNITVPYDAIVVEADGSELTLPGINALASEGLQLGTLPGIVGMPAMMGRVTRLDLTGIAADDLVLTTTDFLTTLPPPPAGRETRTIPFRMLPPEFTGSDPDFPADPRPTFAALPLVDHVIVNGPKAAGPSAHTFLFDTGAQLSLISGQAAIDLGLNLDPADPATDIVDYLTVGGVGGEADIPLVILGEMSVPTIEGDYLTLTDFVVGVLDIPELETSVLAMNFLTSGYQNPLINDVGRVGYFEEAVLDFRGSQLTAVGSMRLTLTPGDFQPPALVTVMSRRVHAP